MANFVAINVCMSSFLEKWRLGASVAAGKSECLQDAFGC